MSSSLPILLALLNLSSCSTSYYSSSSSSFSSSSSPMSLCPSQSEQSQCPVPLDADSFSNPLLQDFVFPPFDVIQPIHVVPGVRHLLNQLEIDLVELEKTVQPSWPELVEPLERILDRLQIVWGIVNHLKSVKDSPDLRAAIDQVQPEKVKFQLRLGQSKPIYNAFKAIQDSSSFSSLTDARKRVVQAQIKEAVLNGVALDDDKREEFNKIEQELEKLSQKFSENVLDATKKFEKLIIDKKEVDGLPPSVLALAAQTASSKGHENATAECGPWMITLDIPSYLPVMQHARSRTLREEVYRAYITRASSGDLDNTAIIDQILKLRMQKAKLLGYKSYAEVSMATKMATVDKAEELLERLRSASWTAAIQGADNLVPMELALKVASKIRAKERFAVYVIIPMWPEGVPTTASVQEILFWQYQTVQMMYDIIAKELKSANIEGSHPQDYLNFYCLGNREELSKEASLLTSDNSEKSASVPSQKFRRFMIYVHSKGMIVDDEYLILGSANINQRSLDGSRDTEIAMGAYQQHHSWAENGSHPRGQVYGYRMSLWAEHLGMVDDLFKKPYSLDCVKKVNEIAEGNWEKFRGEEIVPLDGHLLKYPFTVGADGKVDYIPDQELFPDVGGKILGAPTNLPDDLTM